MLSSWNGSLFITAKHKTYQHQLEKNHHFYTIRDPQLLIHNLASRAHIKILDQIQSFIMALKDMENVASKPSAARVIFLVQVNFWSEHTHFFCREWQKIYPVCFTKLWGVKLFWAG